MGDEGKKYTVPGSAFVSVDVLGVAEARGGMRPIARVALRCVVVRARGTR